MMNHNDHADTVLRLEGVQGDYRDIRERMVEANEFVDKPNGQWETDVWRSMRGKPRYTDDRVTPIINQIAGSIKKANFSMKVRPSSGAATAETAKIYEGLIRQIRNISKADFMFAQAGRKIVKCGFAAWLLEHDYLDDNSFDQDLILSPIHDAPLRVWLDGGDTSNDGSGSRWGVVLHFVEKNRYKEKWPDRQGKGLAFPTWSNSYYHKPETIIIGHYYYIEEEDDQLWLMSDGKVLRASDENESILDELAEAGIEIEETRDLKRKVCKFRMFDGEGWLSEPADTVFDSIPIFPVYANYDVSEGKILSKGKIENLMDQQRVHNYAFSRNVEEVALAPRKKLMMTREQAQGNMDSLRTMNTNLDPVQFYSFVPNQPQPYETGVPQGNVAVQNLIAYTDQSISSSAGLFAANMGDNPNLQSGAAIERMIDQGDNGTSEYFEALEATILRTGQVLVKAIPLVYDATRQVRLLREDEKTEMVILNQVVKDSETGEEVTLNDLSIGKYDVVCDIGPAYKNSQQEASETFLRALEKDPSLIQVGGDIWLENVNAPGFSDIAERLRAIAIANGTIPPSQMTDEERKAEAKKPPAGPSPDEIAMQIQKTQADTQLLREQNVQAQHQIKMQEIQANFARDAEKTQSKLAVDAAKIDQTQQRIDIERFNSQMEAQNTQFQQMMAVNQAQLNEVKALAESLANIARAIGTEGVQSQSMNSALNNTAGKLND